MRSRDRSGTAAILEAYGRVVEFEVRRVLARARWTTLDADDLRNVARYALIIAFSAYRQKPGGKLRSWLHQQVRFALANELRRAEFRREETLTDVPDIFVNGMNPEDALTMVEGMHARTFAVLSPRQYAVVNAMLVGATIQETATSLGVSLGLVHKERRKAIELLEEQIRREKAEK